MSAQILEVGSPVKFIGGTYKGKTGTIEKLTPQKAQVSSPDIAQLVCVMQASLQLEPQQAAPQPTPSPPQPQPPQQASQQPTPQTPSTRRSSRLAGSTPQPPASPCQLPSTPDARGASFGGRPIEKIVLGKEASQSGKHETSFLKEWLGERWRVVEQPLSLGRKPPQLPELSETFDGAPCEFVASKVFDDGSEPWGGKKKCVRMVYADVSGLTTSLQAKLEKWADWRALPSARKVASRLELLQSPGEAHTELGPGEPLTPEMFELIDEPLTDESGGCGFIPEHMLQRLLSRGKGRVPIAAKRATSAQVRVFIRRRGAASGDAAGVFKGVLTAALGIDRIQMSPSMHKVPASREADEDGVCLIITQADPSAPNLQMAKLARGETPCKSFKQAKFSEMIERLWVQGLDVPPAVVARYAGRGKASERVLRQEAWFRGVADPTAAIPSGYVFASGMAAESLPMVGGERCVFVTRSPCVLSTHGRVLRVLTERPASMVPSVWAWLQQRHFGTLYFPREGPPRPEDVAEGDTDGDLYLLCWDAELVGLLARTCTPPPAPAVEQQPPLSSGGAQQRQRLGDDWLAQAHKHMRDPSTLREQAQIGKVHKLMTEFGAELGWGHPDYVWLARAYVQAIDGVKHGGEVQLPAHLREKLGATFAPEEVAGPAA